MGSKALNEHGDGLSLLYQALNQKNREIRVLCFDNPDDGDSALLRFHLETINLSDHDDNIPSYEAISYTWGNSTEREMIQVNGHPMSVPVNTMKALRCIALQHGHHRMFIDAICINQTDLRERSHQVTLMGYVYSKASAVLIWLGEPQGPDYDLSAFTKLVTIYEQVENSDSDDQVKHQIMRNIGLRYPFSPLYRVYEADWFSRTWIIQEVLLARKAICFQGANSVPWAHIVGPATWISRFQRSLYDGHPPSRKAMEGLNNAGRLGAVFGEKTSAERLFAFARTFDCSDPRDKLFALLGLAIHDNWDIPSLVDVVPDYCEPVSTTYIRATRACIEQSRSLKFLHWAGAGMPFHRKPLLQGDFPSWVLRLDSWKWSEPPLNRDSSSADDDTMPAVIHPVKDEHSLSVTGLLVDRIELLAPEYVRRPTGDPKQEQAQFGGAMIRDCVWLADHLYSVFSWALRSLPTCSCKTLANQFLRAWMVTHNFSHNLLEDRDSKYRKALFHILESEARRRGAEDVSLTEDNPVEPFSVEEACRTSLENAQMEDISRKLLHSMFSNTAQLNAWRFVPKEEEHPFIVDLCGALRFTAPRFRFFTTRDGRFGIGPPNMRVGDQICIIYSEGLPAVLRPEHDHWTWVGFAYVETLADGSYVRDLKESGLLEQANQIFELR